MRRHLMLSALSTLFLAGAIRAVAQQPAAQQPEPPDPTRILVGRLTLESYKTTLKGLTQFGDRRQGTKRNRDAVDWIEAQLRAVGCTNTERILYMYSATPPLPAPGAAGARGGGAGGGGGGGAGGRGGGAGGGAAGAPAGVAGRAGGAGGGGGGRGAGTPPDLTTPTGGLVGRNGEGPGGAPIFGYRAPTGVNRDLMAQPDERIRELNREEPVDGERQEVYCTKVGATRPNEMYIVGAHMDGHGVNEAVNDDGSGTALVMELARVFSAPDVVTDVSIRFALWNNEETGLNGATAYVEQRRALQGIEDPAGSGRYPEPRWLGMVQHDMMLWDHGAPRADGTVSRDQRPEADVNIEFQSNSELADQSMKLAFVFKAAADAYNTDYPASVGPHMTNTDSTPFMNIVPSISMRENERGAHTGGGWNPTWHTPLDVWTNFTDKDFRLGLNAAQTTLSALSQLTGAKVGGR